MASYYPEAENFNGSNAGMCSDVARPSSSGLGAFLTWDLALDPVLLLFSPVLEQPATILDSSVTTTPILPFGECYVSKHKVYFLPTKTSMFKVFKKRGITNFA